MARKRERGARGNAGGGARAGAERRSPCPIACTLDLVGDRWSLLVVRDLLLRGTRRYGELLSSPEGIPTNVLADRLRRLAEAGIIESRRYSDRPPRQEYALTERGKALGPVVHAISEWGLRHVPGTERRLGAIAT
jgi:DNA-binding HxlR family transcriptional regulator